MKTAREAFEFWLQSPHQLNDPWDEPMSPGDVFLRFMRMIDEAGYAFVPKDPSGEQQVAGRDAIAPHLPRGRVAKPLTDQWQIAREVYAAMVLQPAHRSPKGA